MFQGSRHTQRQQAFTGMIDVRIYSPELWRHAQDVLDLLYEPERRALVECVTAALLGTGSAYIPSSAEGLQVAQGLAAATPPLLETVTPKRGTRAYVPTPLGRYVALAMLTRVVRPPECRAGDCRPSHAALQAMGDERSGRAGWERATEAEAEPWTPDAWRAWREHGPNQGGGRMGEQRVRLAPDRRPGGFHGRW